MTTVEYKEAGTPACPATPFQERCNFEQPAAITGANTQQSQSNTSLLRFLPVPSTTNVSPARAVVPLRSSPASSGSSLMSSTAFASGIRGRASPSSSSPNSFVVF